MTTIQRLEVRRFIIVTLKFALTTVVSLYLASLLAPMDLLSCAFLALITLQPTLFRGFQTSVDQLKATSIATVVTVLIVFAMQHDLSHGVSYVQAGVTTGLTALITIRLFRPEVTITALFTVLYLSIMPALFGESFWNTVHIRVLTLLIGIGTSTVFNFAFSLLRHRDRLHLNLVHASTVLRDLFLEMEEAFSAGRRPDGDQLRGFLMRFRDIFAAIGRVQVDIEEVQRESSRFHRKGEEDEDQLANRLRLAISRKMNNVAHYVWNMLITLVNYELGDEEYEELRQALVSNVMTYRRAHRGLAQDQTVEMEERDVEGLARSIADSLVRHAAAGDEDLVASAALLSDMVQMQVNVIQYADHVQRYVSCFTRGRLGGNELRECVS